MSWTNYHMHCHYCHGKGTPEAYVQKALEMGMKSIGFSGHSPVPFESDWNMKQESVVDYCREIIDLKERYRDRIQIYLGMEVDYVHGITEKGADACAEAAVPAGADVCIGTTVETVKPDQTEAVSCPEASCPKAAVFPEIKLDYIIGSVHYLAPRMDGGGYQAVDDDPQGFEACLNEVYGGDIRKMAEDYFGFQKEMLKSMPLDIIAHFDLIKKNNNEGLYFSEDEQWYRNFILNALNAIKQAGVILEVNTGGITRNYIDTVYPSPWILQRALELRIPVTLSADAHRPDDIAGCYEFAADILRETGYRKLMVLDRGKWVECGFTSRGIDL